MKNGKLQIFTSCSKPPQIQPSCPLLHCHSDGSLFYRLIRSILVSVYIHWTSELSQAFEILPISVSATGFQHSPFYTPFWCWWPFHCSGGISRRLCQAYGATLGIYFASHTVTLRSSQQVTSDIGYFLWVTPSESNFKSYLPVHSPLAQSWEANKLKILSPLRS